jgi:predicted O-methyltransferase YrrM
MPKLLYPDLTSYRRTLFAPEDDLLKEIMPTAAQEGVPDIAVSPESGQTLYLLAKMIGARKILEFGALAGYSGIWLARALPPDGRFITLEINPKHADVTQRNYAKAGLGNQAEVRVGPGKELMHTAAAEGPFDLVFIDADKEGYPTYLDFALANTRIGGLIIADNADGHGHVHEDLGEGSDIRGIQLYNERVAKHPRLVSNIIPVGGWLAVSLVVA